VLDDVVLRPYEPGDRARVRRICFDTGYMGEPEWQWRDPESFADLYTSYYTDAEPQSAIVAERAGVVEGYLLGCLDSRRAWSEASIFVRLLRRRWIAVRPSTARFVWRSFADVGRDRLLGRPPPEPVHDDRWPAHLHIDLLPGIRGRGVGAAMLRVWLARLDDAGVAGCHVQTLAENVRAVAAFESVGFERRGDPAPVPGLRTRGGGRHHVQLLTRSAAAVS
jgi:RimJ/RimL family protein N-acetyltransferase